MFLLILILFTMLMWIAYIKRFILFLIFMTQLILFPNLLIIKFFFCLLFN